RERFLQRDRRKHEGQGAGRERSLLYRFGELRHRTVTGVEIGSCRKHTDDRARQRLVVITCRLQKSPAQEEREFVVAILHEARAQAPLHAGAPAVSLASSAESSLRSAGDSGSSGGRTRAQSGDLFCSASTAFTAAIKGNFCIRSRTAEAARDSCSACGLRQPS